MTYRRGPMAAMRASRAESPFAPTAWLQKVQATNTCGCTFTEVAAIRATSKLARSTHSCHVSRRSLYTCVLPCQPDAEKEGEHQNNTTTNNNDNAKQVLGQKATQSAYHSTRRGSVCTRFADMLLRPSADSATEAINTAV